MSQEDIDSLQDAMEGHLRAVVHTVAQVYRVFTPVLEALMTTATDVPSLMSVGKPQNRFSSVRIKLPCEDVQISSLHGLATYIHKKGCGYTLNLC